MSLRYVEDNLEDVPRALHHDYERGTDGKYHLALADKHPDSVKVREMRDNNITLLKELEELRPLKAKYEGVDPDAARAALAKAADVEQMREKLAALESRPDPTKLEAELVAERDAHAATKFRNQITTACLTAGVRDSAIDYVITSAEKIFAVDGTTTEPSKQNPGTNLTISEWLQSLSQSSDFLFKPSRGGGAGPRSETHRLGAIRAQNELVNPTAQELGKHASEIASGKLKVVYS
jgi:hypothetical protein